MCAFGDYLAPVLVAVHMVNNLGLGEEKAMKMRVMKAKVHKIWPWSGLGISNENVCYALDKREGVHCLVKICSRGSRSIR